MPDKYHIKTTPVPPRLQRVGKFGIVDWREDCARCHNCVKKACVYDRYRQETEYIKNLDEVNTLFFECMGCFSCVQNCTKGLLCLTINSEYERLGNHYWTPEIIQTTWTQAETASVPVSGAGYRGKFSGAGFDSMWTDMSEIVRPTRDGIHGREYISTYVDIGKNLSFLSFEDKKKKYKTPPQFFIPLPLIIDMSLKEFSFPNLENIIIETANITDLISIIDSKKWPDCLESSQKNNIEKYLPNIAFYLNPDAPEIPSELLSKTRLVEIPDSEEVLIQFKEIKNKFSNLIVSVRVELDKNCVKRVQELTDAGIEVIHAVADYNGDEIREEKPKFIKDVIRDIHISLIKSGKRDEVTLIAGGGIALAEHMAKAIICGADIVSAHLPLMVALECRLCSNCNSDSICPAELDNVEFNYGVGRMRNLIAAWHLQLIEVMGAMGMREVRRLRGDVGRAMFYEDLEEEIFGSVFGTRKRA